MPTINVNTDALVKYTNKLEKLGRSGLPIAVRNTLNAVALDVKTRTMPRTALDSFDNREKNFFKANSRVNFAKGFDLKTMQSEVGFTGTRLKGGNNFAVKDLEQQEHGGQIKGRSFMPLPGARKGNTELGLIQTKSRISGLKNVIDATKAKGSRKSRFIRSAFMAKKLYGNNAFVLGNPSKGKRTLSRIDAISSNGENVKIRRTALYSYEKGRVAKVEQTNFMKRASFESRLRAEPIFVEFAEKQLKRLQLK